MVVCGIYSVYGQDYIAFKKRLGDEEKKYKEEVLCERTTKAAIHNLNELIWAKPNKDKIVKSCDFIKNQKNGCPQPELINLLTEIKTAYKVEGGVDEGASDLVDENAPVSNSPDTMNSPEVTNTTTVKQSPIGSFTIIYIWFAVLSLVCIWLAYKIFQTPIVPISYSSQSEQNMKNELLEKLGDADLIDVLKQMRDQIGVLVQKVSSLEEDVQVLKQLQQNQDKNTDVQTQFYPKERIADLSPHEEKHPPKEDETPFVITPKVPDNYERRYALYMDNSEGFSIAGLMYAESAETIYEIILTSPHVAMYRICSNTEAQSYALSDPGYYLRTACDYDNSPSSGKHIETLSEGQLEQVGNIWKITKKARIRFV